MRRRWAAAVLGVWCGVGLAENLPRGMSIKTPRRPLSAAQVAEQDQIYQRHRKSRYIDGPRRVSVQPLAGKWLMPLESMGLVFNADGTSDLRLNRGFRKDKMTAWSEGVGGRLDNVDYYLSIHRSFETNSIDDFGFITWLLINSIWFKYITPEAHDRIEADHPTDLARADAIYGLTRKDVFGPGRAPNAENMAWLLCGSLDLMGDDNLTRYRIGDLIYYVASITQSDEADRIRYRGVVFDARDGKWAGYISCDVRTVDKTSPGTPAVEAILSRLSPVSKKAN